MADDIPDEHASDGEPAPPQVPAVDDATANDAASAALRRATRSTSKARKRTPRGSTAGVSRDPQPLGAALENLIEQQGWRAESSVAVLMSQWAEIVGRDLAEHVTPVSFTEGELILQAESTTWATQTRLLLPQLHAAVDERVGSGVVRAIRVRGPQGPTWAAGPRRVKGRGPRDTYG